MIGKPSQQLTLPHGSLALALASPIINHSERPLVILFARLTHQHQLHRLTMTWAYTYQVHQTSNIMLDLLMICAFFVGLGLWVASVVKVVELG